MIKSDLAIRIQSFRPLALEPIAGQKFLSTLAEVNSDEQLERTLRKVAYSKPSAKEASPKKKADDDDEKEHLLRMFAMPWAPKVTSKGTACICIKGVIGKNLNPMEKMLGCTDINDIYDSLKSFEKNQSIKRVILKINSGGGTTTGLEEIARYIFNYPKETIAFTDEDMGSAAYWIGSQCQRVIVTPSSTVGSVGIYVSLVDNSKQFADEGKEVILIKSGEYKGAGVEGVGLTQLQGDWIQDEVIELHDTFKGNVKRARPLISDKDLQGQSFSGSKAAERNIVTGLVDSFDELMEQLEGQFDGDRFAPVTYSGVQPKPNTLIR
jgi:protease-4